ncbi:MAG: TetR/AcrR family transcriptional regulator [Dehalococcoidia bacterium]
MILDRAGVGQGSMYHHYRGKEDLALDAISHMRDRSRAFLEGRVHPGPPTEVPGTTGSPDLSTEGAAALASVEAALAGLFERNEGHALLRLLADPTVGAIESLAVATQAWCNDLRAAIIAGLDTDTPGDAEAAEAAEAAVRILAPELDALATTVLTAALGRGLIGLPRFVFDHPHDLKRPDVGGSPYANQQQHEAK